MKQIAIVIIAMFTMTLSAQENHKNNHENERKEHHKERLELTPEEASQLQTKKMTLSLDLDNAQQQQISQINLENAKRRMAKMEARKNTTKDDQKERPSKEDRLQKTNDRLDAKIANKKKMKGILNDEQYKKWEHQSARKHDKKRKMRGKNTGQKRMKRQR